MRVGVDVTELAGPPGGVRTAIELLLSAVHKYAPDIELTALAPNKVDVPTGVHMVATGGPERSRAWRRSRALREATRHLDLFHSPVLAHPDWKHIPVVATVHELPFVVHVRLEGFGRAMSQWRWLSSAMSQCCALVAPSNATLEQIRMVHPGAVSMTEVIPHPAPEVQEMQHDHDGSLLFLGRLDRRKSVEALLEGCARSGGKVRLAGPHDEQRKEQIQAHVRRLGMEDRVEFLGEVDDSMREFLYRRAGVVALISRSEGFGFPVLEALGRGVPVMVGKGTGAEEVGGDVVLAVDPQKPEEVADAWRAALETDHRAAVRTRGPARVLEFSPSKAAAAYEKLWKRAAAR